MIPKRGFGKRYDEGSCYENESERGAYDKERPRLAVLKFCERSSHEVPKALTHIDNEYAPVFSFRIDVFALEKDYTWVHHIGNHESAENAG
jgi:hypothetical protein